MARTTSEWHGKTDNHMPPATVRQRILDRENGICHVCRGKIDKPGWHADHVPPLKDGGENRESMIKPAHAICHIGLTAKQAVARAPIERMKMNHTGAARPTARLQSAPFPKTDRTARRAEKASGKALPPRRSLYEQWQPVGGDVDA